MCIHTTLMCSHGVHIRIHIYTWCSYAHQRNKFDEQAHRLPAGRMFMCTRMMFICIHKMYTCIHMMFMRKFPPNTSDIRENVYICCRRLPAEAATKEEAAPLSNNMYSSTGARFSRAAPPAVNAVRSVG